MENEDKLDETPVAESEEEPEPIVDFDAVFIPDNYPQFALIAPQFPFHSVFNVQFLGTSLWQAPELLEIAGDYVQNAIFPSGFYNGSESEEVISFVNLYRENFEEEPGVLAATGYDTMRFLKALIRNNQINTRKGFLDTLLTFNDFIGVTGKISFDRHGEVTKDPILLRVSGKTFKTLP
ncbi:MAG: ABC transporter substrate-binding protein [Deltaproteobacteria bacterium]|nr:ABC transporter substrate-binding protein [Deltaproteobacteria bacterium]